MSVRKNWSIAKLLLGGYTASVVSLLIYLPIFLLILFSFHAKAFFSFPFAGFSLRWYMAMFEEEFLFRSLGNSLIIASIVTAAAMVLGLPAAFTFASLRGRKKDIFIMFMAVPFVIPWLLIGVASLIFYITVGMELSFLTVVLSHLTYSIPVVVIIVGSRLLTYNIRLNEAAMDLGADQLQVFRKIMLPQIFPAVAAAALITFIWSFDNFIITYFTIGSDLTFPIWVWSSIRYPKKLPIVNAVSAIIVIVGSLIIYLLHRKGLLEEII